MKIYITYWAQVRNFPPNLVGLNTTVWPPKWRPLGKDKNNVWVIDCWPLKPGAACEGLCNGSCEPKHPKNCEFLKIYKQQLDCLDFDNFCGRLVSLKKEMEEGEGIKDINFAIVVFEKYDKPCSERWPLKQWFKEHGVELEEWKL